ncbi:MAG TPA: mercuric transport protein MerTP [Phaeodactylibacter sp.]|nr:mercuric transport protein MerTP [Phaeodactylibacter sp.]
MKKDKKLIWTSVFTAIGASLCCITPVLALISGATGMASTFSWLDPFRPYLMGVTVLVLGYAWYQKLFPKQEMACNCEEEKTPFMQTKTFLSIVTIFAIAMLFFPSYASVFYPKNKKEVIVVDASQLQNIKLDIEGMTCASCEEHINHAVNQLDGIVKMSASYKNGNAIIEFDSSKTTVEDIKNAINSTGYKIKKQK